MSSVIFKKLLILLGITLPASANAYNLIPPTNSTECTAGKVLHWEGTDITCVPHVNLTSACSTAIAAAGSAAALQFYPVFAANPSAPGSYTATGQWDCQLPPPPSSGGGGTSPPPPPSGDGNN